ncbi:MAG: hypothetical protein FWG85_04755 [Bacteroidetes bacterium]|nr:hypothetical protein [Bacteroidota bacterium]
METLELEKPINKIKVQETDLYDEEGYLIASLEEGLADERAGLGMSFKSWDDMMKYIDEEIFGNVNIFIIGGWCFGLLIIR